MVRLTKAKKPKGYIDEQRFGILNPYGDIWTSDTFRTEAAAQKHIKDFWQCFPDTDLTSFKVIRVRVHVTVAPALEPLPHE
jgi:hypothetical protein